MACAGYLWRAHAALRAGLLKLDYQDNSGGSQAPQEEMVNFGFGFILQ